MAAGHLLSIATGLAKPLIETLRETSALCRVSATRNRETSEGNEMATSLEGTVALITGASSGIGEATARALAAQGAKVAVAARRLERLERLAEEIGGGGHTALAIESDITDQAQAIAAVERTVDELGRLDIVVNNAGQMLLGPIEDAPTEEWDRMIDLNLKGLINTTHAALPHLLAAAEDSERGCADLVNISSVAGRIARSGSGVYNLTKHGVGAFSESFRQEFASRKVGRRSSSPAPSTPS